MKICHVSYHAALGGGAIAAMRLHQALKQQQTDSVFLAVDPDGCPDAIAIASPWEQKKLLWKQRLLWRLYQLQRSRNITAHSFDILSSGFVPRILANKPDIVHLHVVNGEMLSIGEIAELCSQVKVVWTLHDSWPFCGTEQHPLQNGNERYKHGYTKKNKEDSGIDFDRFLWERKRKLWNDKEIHFIAPSRWMEEMLKSSNLFMAADIHHIGNTVNTALFSPVSQTQILKELVLPDNKFLIGFGASSLMDSNKGGLELANILDHLAMSAGDKIELITVGHGSVKSPLKNNALGYIKDEKIMVKFYQACDLFVLPSKYDNLPNMILESMACGTPVAAFDTGGIGDLVKPDCGLLVPAYDVDCLCRKICNYIDSPRLLGKSSRNHIEKNYSPSVIAARHIELYQSI